MDDSFNTKKNDINIMINVGEYQMAITKLYRFYNIGNELLIKENPMQKDDICFKSKKQTFEWMIHTAMRKMT